jgi:hypothetical protein
MPYWYSWFLQAVKTHNVEITKGLMYLLDEHEKIVREKTLNEVKKLLDEKL